MTHRSTAEWAEMVRRVADAPTEIFTDLVRDAGLNEKTDLRFGDFSGVSFKNSNLRGCDFTGAKLVNCDFKEALITGARFDHVVIGTVPSRGALRQSTVMFQQANDWSEYRSKWAAPLKSGNERASPGSIIYDSPYSSPLVILARSMPKIIGAPSPVDRQTRLLAVGQYPIEVADVVPNLFPRQDEKGRPRTEVTQYMARAYIAWLHAKTGIHYRLLSENEWLSVCGMLPSVHARQDIANRVGLFAGTSAFHFRALLKAAGAGTKNVNRALSSILGIQSRLVARWANGAGLPPVKQRASIIDRILKEYHDGSNAVRLDPRIPESALLHTRGMRIARDVLP